jgi:hypothetical protein
MFATHQGLIHLGSPLCWPVLRHLGGFVGPRVGSQGGLWGLCLLSLGLVVSVLYRSRGLSPAEMRLRP